jgi:prophage tail gpP-like protein
MSHHHDDIDDHEPFALRIIPVTLDDEAAALEPVHNVTPSETQSALWRDRFHETIEDLELQSPNSFVLNLEPISNESAEKKKKKSPKRSPKKSPKKLERNTRASLAKTALAAGLSPEKSPSSP